MSKAKLIRHTKNARVLLVDDNIDLIKLMSIRFKPLELDLKTAESSEEALNIISLWMPELIITDLQLPGMSGMELFDIVHAENPLIPIIVLTAHGTIPDAVAATQAGVATFLSKPFDGKLLMNEIQSALVNRNFAQNSKSKVQDKDQTLVNRNRWRENICTNSRALDPALRLIDRFAPTNDLLIFEGEAGTGKSELVRSAHVRSTRAEKQLVHISCASFTDDHLEKEIYGKIGDGSANEPEIIGALRRAHGGTFVVEQAHQASPAFIARLLECLITKKATAIDSDIEYEFDVRVMATTNGVEQYDKRTKRTWLLTGQLDATVIQIPPLREHREDIPAIAIKCLEKMDLEEPLAFSYKAMQLITSADWPGNFRQLVSVVRQCARLTRTKIISETLVNSRLNAPVFKIRPMATAHQEFERNYLTEVLKATNGNVTRAASMAERNRTEFHRLLKKHKIEAASYRQTI